jgi:high frequency lysogenization protein
MDRALRQCLALSAVGQAAYMVKQLAHHGMVGQDKLNTMVRSTFVQNPHTLEDIYGNVSRLNLGMQVLQEIIRNEGGSLVTPEVTRYFLGILHLERKLSSQRGMLNSIGDKLSDIAHPDLGDPDLASPDILQALASVYQDTLSTLSFRIQVTGEMQQLKNDDVAKKIRAVLLSGIRAAVLWQQVGGRRWHLLFKRNSIGRNLLLLINRIHDIH